MNQLLRQAEAEVQRLIVDLLWADPRGKTGTSVKKMAVARWEAPNPGKIRGKRTKLMENHGKSWKNHQTSHFLVGFHMFSWGNVWKITGNLCGNLIV